MNQELKAQLDKARNSLQKYLDFEPCSSHKLLLNLYQEVEVGLKDPDEFPTARHLFWDEPNSDLERECLEDAVLLFQLASETKRS